MSAQAPPIDVMAHRSLTPRELQGFLVAECRQCLSASARDNCTGVHGGSAAMAKMRRRPPWDFSADGTLSLLYLPQLCPFAFANKRHAATPPPGIFRLVTHSLAPLPLHCGYPLRDADIACPFGAACPWAHTDRELWFHPLVYRNEANPSNACTRGAGCVQKFCAYYHPGEKSPIPEELMVRMKTAAQTLQDRIDNIDRGLFSCVDDIDKLKDQCRTLVAELCGVACTAGGAGPVIAQLPPVPPAPATVAASAPPATVKDDADKLVACRLSTATAIGAQLHTEALAAASVLQSKDPSAYATLITYTERTAILASQEDFVAKQAITREGICSIARHMMELLMNMLLDHFKCRIAPSWSLTDKCVQLKDHMARPDTHVFFRLKELACLPDHHPRGDRERYHITDAETITVLYMMLSTLYATINNIQRLPPEPAAAASDTPSPPLLPSPSTSARPIAPAAALTAASAAAPVPPIGARHKRVPKNYKTTLCRNWKLHGDCAHGDRCSYAHGSRELRQ